MKLFSGESFTIEEMQLHWNELPSGINLAELDLHRSYREGENPFAVSVTGLDFKAKQGLAKNIKSR